jgi:hypothetical protein
LHQKAMFAGIYQFGQRQIVATSGMRPGSHGRAEAR